MTEHVLEARSLIKTYSGARVVDGVDIDVAAGECWGLLGPNGAGKTTFLRMAIGNTPPTSGELRVLGYDIPAQASNMRQRIGVVPQLDNLDPDFTVEENLLTYGTYFGLDAKELEQRITELLDFASLERKANQPITALSGGMQRRLSLSRALINAPELLILDEPTTGLDPQARQLIWQRLRELRAQGISQILTTHYMDEAERLCDRITIMDHGRILDTERPSVLIQKYIEPEVVEVHGSGLDEWHTEHGVELSQRSEQVGSSIFYYAANEDPLVAALREQPSLVFLHRRANLEDVFLKLTGRDLRDS